MKKRGADSKALPPTSGAQKQKPSLKKAQSFSQHPIERQVEFQNKALILNLKSTITALQEQLQVTSQQFKKKLDEVLMEKHQILREKEDLEQERNKYLNEILNQQKIIDELKENYQNEQAIKEIQNQQI